MSDTLSGSHWSDSFALKIFFFSLLFVGIVVGAILS